jgi:glycosyltransferase involved in cell wall biosynthesis
MLQQYKGISEIIKAMPAIIKKEPKACLVIAGTGEDEGTLRKLAVATGLQARIKFVGTIHEKLAPHYYNMCNVFYSGSFHHSGLDLTLQEAAACGKAIVACDVGSKVRTLVSPQVGITYALGDIDGLTDAVIKCLTGSVAENLGKAAYEMFKKKFTLTQMISKLELLFKKEV